MIYSLNKTDVEKEKEKGVLSTAWKRLIPLMAEEKRSVTIAFVAILGTAAATLVVPIIIAHIVDVYIATKNFKECFCFPRLDFLFFVGVASN